MWISPTHPALISQALCSKSFSPAQPLTSVLETECKSILAHPLLKPLPVQGLHPTQGHSLAPLLCLCHPLSPACAPHSGFVTHSTSPYLALARATPCHPALPACALYSGFVTPFVDNTLVFPQPVPTVSSVNSKSSVAVIVPAVVVPVLVLAGEIRNGA